MQRDPFPYWPALLTTEMAAGYLMVGENAFRAIALRAGIQPVELGVAVTRWRRADLDALVDKLPYRGAVEGSPTTQANEPDQAAAALERVRRRAGG